MMRLDLMFRDKVKELIPPRHRAKLQEQLQSRLEERKNRIRRSLAGPSKQSSKGKTGRGSLLPLGQRTNNSLRQSNLIGNGKEFPERCIVCCKKSIVQQKKQVGQMQNGT